MANPQTKDGFTQIANELLEAIMKIRISGEARQVFDSIIRKTYGYHKKKDIITLSQFTESTALSKTAICKAIKKLLSMNLITKKAIVTKKVNGKVATYSIVKDYNKWKPLPKKEINQGCYQKRKLALPKKEIAITQKVDKTLPKKWNTKERKKEVTKETLTKDSCEPIGSLNEKRKIPETDHHQIIKYWMDEHEKKFGMKYDFNGRKDGPIIKRLLKVFGYDKLMLIMDAMLLSNDKFYKKMGGYTIGVLSSNANKLAQQLANPQNPQFEGLSEKGKEFAQTAIRVGKELGIEMGGNDDRK